MFVAEAIQGKEEKIAHEEQGLLQVTGILQVTDFFFFFQKEGGFEVRGWERLDRGL